MNNEISNLFKTIAIALLFIAPIAAWLTHVIVSLSEASWGILIAGAILFPIGIIHGIGIWFGAF